MVEERVTYRIDSRDAITDVGEAWVAFATGNQTPHLADDILGRQIWDYVVDDTTRQVYRDLIARVRAGHEVTFAYRCDAPALRRFMRMTMRPAPDRAVDFDSVVERTEPRSVVPLFEGTGAGSSGVIVRLCSWCKRVHVRETWQEVEAAVNSLQLFAGGPMPALTHGMCEDCYARVMQDGGL